MSNESTQNTNNQTTPTPSPASPTPASPTPASPSTDNQTTPASPTPASPTPASPTPASPTPASPSTDNQTTPASPTPASPTPASPTPASPSTDNQTTGYSPTPASPSTDNQTTGYSPSEHPSPLFAPSPSVSVKTSPLSPSPQLLDDVSVVPMVALLIFALAMGVVFTFRKHIRKITFQQNAYHTIDEGAPEQELTMIGPYSKDIDVIDDGKITEEDINNMI
jgi:hypothetical protein